MPAEPIFRFDAYANTAAARVVHASADGIRLDRTIFYPLGGGQPGDSGVLSWQGRECRIVDTKKWRKDGEAEDISHMPAPADPLPPAGATVELRIDWERRFAHMRMHTCLHLLSAILREAAVTGGQIGAEKSRLDFDIPSDRIDKDELSRELNRLILENHPVAEKWITDEELASQPDLVRTMSVKPPMGLGRVRLLAIGNAFDLQPCGGTHVRGTAEIGPVDVLKIENKGRQNRRVTVALRRP